MDHNGDARPPLQESRQTGTDVESLDTVSHLEKRRETTALKKGKLDMEAPGDVSRPISSAINKK